jgi:uncharacterized repeat protein (TIGR01451 family)
MLLSSAVYSNTSEQNGGGIRTSAQTYLENVTLSTNTSLENGGGLAAETGASVDLLNVTINDNIAFDLGASVYSEVLARASNTIIASGAGSDNCFGALISDGSNLDDGDSCDLIASLDLVNTDPKLGPLDTNGGPTPNHSLLPGSPAIDAGQTETCPEADQRGVVRPQGVACDIGAYERTQAADLSVTKQAVDSTVNETEQVRFTITVTNDGPDTPASVRMSDVLPEGLTLVEVTASAGECSGTVTVICDIEGLAPDASVEIEVVTQPDGPGQYVNTATVSSELADPDPSNDEAHAIVSVQPAADLTLDVTAEPSTVAPGETFVVTVGVSNQGPSDTGEITLVTPFADPFAVQSVDAPGWTCGLTEGEDPVYTCTAGDLSLASGSPEFTVMVDPDLDLESQQEFVLEFEVFAESVDPQPEDNEASVTVTVRPLDAPVVLFEGWNEVEDWGGASTSGVANVIALLELLIEPDVWDSIAQYDGAVWLQTFSDAPLPSFNTLTEIEAGEDYWIYVTEEALLDW